MTSELTSFQGKRLTSGTIQADWSVINDDCIQGLKGFPDDHFESLVTDPPAGIAFMGKDWDKDKGGRDHWIDWMSGVMRECLRVLKPGAHGFVWALPRTSHWTATALENAGFEIRDVVMHVFGSGFPKSHNISKALDKKAGAEREVIGQYKSPEAKSRTSTHSAESNYRPGQKEIRLADTLITAPSTPEAKQWDGWGTALKPAAEHWILVRKPIEGTVADNVLKYGVGGLNIDGCRVEGKPDKPGGMITGGFGGGLMKGGDLGRIENTDYKQPQGRFPSHFVMSHSPHCTDEQCDIECAIKMLDGQAGNIRSRHGYKRQGQTGGGTGNAYTMEKCSIDKSEKVVDPRQNGYLGGPSRYFYCAKSSKRERNEGLEGTNGHPTVKPTKLMQYLIRMVTPPGGWVLDPFTGSGSTGVAAVKAGFNFQGIEKEAEYTSIAENRIKSACGRST